MKYESKMSWLVYYQVCGMITYSISHCSVHSMTHKDTFTLTGQKSLRIFSINIINNNRFLSGDIIDISESLVTWLSSWRQPCIDDSQIKYAASKNTETYDTWLWGKNPHKLKVVHIVCCYIWEWFAWSLKIFIKCHLSYCSRDLSKYTGHYQTDQL